AGATRAAAAGVVLLVRPGAPPAWVQGESRPLEARLSHPRAAIYRPYQPARGSAPAAANVDYGAYQEAQRRGDRKGLVTLLLLHGDRTQASALLAEAGDAELDDERAVLALGESRPD